MTYKILERKDSLDLEGVVQKYLEKGYKPQGGVSVYFDSSRGVFGQTYYAQAMIKEKA